MTDVLEMIATCVSNINFKLVLMMFIMFILLNTDVFNRYIMKHFDGTVGVTGVSTYGNMIKAFIFVIIYILLDSLIYRDVL